MENKEIVLHRDRNPAEDSEVAAARTHEALREAARARRAKDEETLLIAESRSRARIGSAFWWDEHTARRILAMVEKGCLSEE